MTREVKTKVAMTGTLLSSMAVYGLFLGGFFFAVSFYNGTDDSGINFNSKRLILIALVSTLTLIASFVALAIGWYQSKQNRRMNFWVPLVFNVVVLVATFWLVELVLRYAVQADPFGEKLGETILLPYDWKKVSSSNMRLYENSLDEEAYFVGDAEVGWSIGRDRRSKDGLYVSSLEGLRSSIRGASLMDEKYTSRVALFGNSFVFSEEVSYPDSLSKHLKQRLPTRVQILNFGVPGYGIDQAVMRFQRAAEPWQPRVAVLGFIADDILRAANVYAFLKPSFAVPFSKPRFVRADEESSVRVLNSPNISPPEMYALESVFDLPFLRYDISFFGHAWKKSPMHSSFLFRYFVSVFPRWRERGPLTSDAALRELAYHLIKGFHTEASVSGIKPLIVYMPSRGDFTGNDRNLVQQVIDDLAESGVETINLRECGKAGVKGLEDFVVGGAHYSGVGNAAAADCLAPIIDSLLAPES